MSVRTDNIFTAVKNIGKYKRWRSDIVKLPSYECVLNTTDKSRRKHLMNISSTFEIVRYKLSSSFWNMLLGTFAAYWEVLRWMDHRRIPLQTRQVHFEDNNFIFKTIDARHLITDETVLGTFAGTSCDRTEKFLPYSKRDAIMVTDRRIMVTETEMLFWLPIFRNQQFFLLEDLRQIQFTFDYRVRYVIYVLLLLCFSIVMPDFMWKATLLLPAGVFFLKFLFSIFTRGFLSMHFHKKKVVHSWLPVLRNYFVAPKEGTSQTLRLCLSYEQSRALMALLCEHNLCVSLTNEWNISFGFRGLNSLFSSFALNSIMSTSITHLFVQITI